MAIISIRFIIGMVKLFIFSLIALAIFSWGLISQIWQRK